MSLAQKSIVDIGIVVLSCDKYSDLWPPFFELFFRSWGGAPYPVYLLANQKKYSDARVKILLSGEDTDWSSSIKICLKNIKHEYVWVIFDDVFFDKKIDWGKIQRLMDFLKEKKPSYLRFRPVSKPDERIDRYFGRYKENTLYRTSVFAIWNRDVLLEALKEGESAWEFEYNSPSRVLRLPNFYGVYEEYIPYIHGVVKGLWLRSAVEKLKELGVTPNLSLRPEMSDAEHRKFMRAEKREKIFNGVPAFLRPILLLAKKKVSGTLSRLSNLKAQ